MDYGIFIRLRYMTEAKERPRISHEINKRICQQFRTNSEVDFAIPFVYSYRTGEKEKDILIDQECRRKGGEDHDKANTKTKSWRGAPKTGL